MPEKKWLIYGAYGYTGVLVAEEALRRGHKPVLAGRSAEKLAPLANRLGLESIVIDLNDENALAKTLADFDLVFHAAGPFIHTSAPMVRACLKSKTNYLDITGEVPVFEQNFALDQQAKEAGIAIISGVGFDVVPTDCLAKYVAEKISDPLDLELAFAAPGGTSSAGTTKTMLEHMPAGVIARRNGQLIRVDMRKGERRIDFSDRERIVLPISWGDLATAFYSTGIPNITTYLAFPENLASRMRWIAPIGRRLMAFGPARRLAQKWVEKSIHGPDEQTRKTARCYLWACATNRKGDQHQAWLETPEGYHFTALAGVRCVEKIFAAYPKGALSPAMAFGADFVLEIPGTKRMDSIAN